jgi:predicted homoserine dehydrogenase-like protein
MAADRGGWRLELIIVDTALAARASAGNPVRIAMIGAGYMGVGMTRHITQNMPGLAVSVIANRTVEHAVAAFQQAGIEHVEEVHDLDSLNRAIAAGRAVVTKDALLAVKAQDVEAVMEATGEVEFGARVATTAIEHRKHVVLVNAELDATVGPLLKTRADKAGVILTNADGDEPGVAMNLVRFVRSIGYRPVLAGNVKGFYDPHRNPDTQRGFAEQHGQRPKMITSFADGTKLSMEGTVLANATGFRVRRRGMTGERIGHVKDVLGIYDLDELLEDPIVDFVLGAEPGSGAFVVGHNGDPAMRAYMDYFKMGEGPFHVFYRPFHLTHLEAPLSVARAVLFGDAAIAPAGPPVTEVLTVAKIDLEVGDELDGIGGFSCYGMIENSSEARRLNSLPMGLSDQARLTRAVAADELVTWDDVELPQGRVATDLWREQSDLFGMSG